MKIERKDAPPIVIGNRIPLGVALGSAVSWLFWLGDTYWWSVEIPTAMVTQFTTIVIALAQIWWVQVYGITTGD